jgi:hypothetical protein
MNDENAKTGRGGFQHAITRTGPVWSKLSHVESLPALLVSRFRSRLPHAVAAAPAARPLELYQPHKAWRRWRQRQVPQVLLAFRSQPR